MKSIKSRLIISILAITIIPVMAFLVYSLIFVSDDQIQSELKENETKISWASQHLKAQTGQLRDVMYSLHLEESLLTDVDDFTGSPAVIENILRNTLYANSNIVSNITVVSSKTNRMASIDYERGFTRRLMIDNHRYVQLQGTPIGIGYAMINEELVVFHTINDFKTQEEQGLIIIQLKRSFIQEFIDIFGPDVDFMIFSSKGLIIANTNPTESFVSQIYDQHNGRTNIESTILGNRYVWASTVPNHDIYIASILDADLITGLNNRLIGIGLLIILISLSTTIPVAVILSNRITNPIIGLVNHMNDFEFSHVKGNFKSYDELKLLEDSYNHMIDEMTKMVRERYKNKIAMQDAQLKALQAQINPHFLANTFQMISGMALSVDAPQIYDATIKMSHILRYSMKVSEGAVTLREEIDHIGDYLSIQKLRFGEALNIKINVPVTMNKVRIPKLTLQPIIENSFRHGFIEGKETMTITIECVKEEDYIIRIIDDGIGINLIKLESVNAELVKGVTLGDTFLEYDIPSIGLGNIDARIKLLYGLGYGISLSQSSVGGMITTIRLPKEANKDETTRRR